MRAGRDETLLGTPNNVNFSFLPSFYFHSARVPRSFVLVEAGDEFTRQFYRSHFDVVDFTPVDIS